MADLISFPAEDLMALLGVGTVLAAIFFAIGVLAGLLLRSAPSSLVAGLLLKSKNTFQPGDLISTRGVTGIVASIRWFNIQLVLSNNSTLLIPNIDLLGSPIINHTAKRTCRIDIILEIARGDDLNSAADIIKEVLSKDARVLEKPPVRISIDASESDGVTLIAQPWVAAKDYQQARSDVAQSIRRLLAAEDIRLHDTSG